MIESLNYRVEVVQLSPGTWVGDEGMGLISFVGLGLNFLLDLVVELGLFWV